MDKLMASLLIGAVPAGTYAAVSANGNDAVVVSSDAPNDLAFADDAEDADYTRSVKEFAGQQVTLSESTETQTAATATASSEKTPVLNTATKTSSNILGAAPATLASPKTTPLASTIDKFIQPTFFQTPTTTGGTTSGTTSGTTGSTTSGSTSGSTTQTTLRDFTTTSAKPTTSTTTGSTQFTSTTFFNNTTTTARQTTTTQRATTTQRPTTTVQATTTANNGGGRTLVWSEEFNSFNSYHWSKENSTYGDGNNELQCYDPNNVQISGGKLKLTAEKRTITCPGGKTRQYASGMVRSKNITFSPGQSIEYRVKLTPNDDNNQAGLWPAFWSSSWGGGGWPRGGEWDGFEVMTAKSPYRSVFSIHYTNTSGSHGKKSKEVYKSDKFSDSWHTMRFDYGHNGVLVWYMDGAVMNTISDADTVQGWPVPFDQAMKSFKVNLALGGSPGALDDRALPATYEIDYVRIYNS